LVFPGRGLTLYKVDYPDTAELLERAKKTVARREEEEN
jgi:tRNA pseudouridine38-40 synthase